MVKRTKNGTVKMSGNQDEIFTDIVRIVDAYCVSHAKIIENADETKLLTAIVLGVAKEGDSNIDLEMMRKVLKKVKLDD